MIPATHVLYSCIVAELQSLSVMPATHEQFSCIVAELQSLSVMPATHEQFSCRVAELQSLSVIPATPVPLVVVELRSGRVYQSYILCHIVAYKLQSCTVS